MNQKHQAAARLLMKPPISARHHQEPCCCLMVPCRNGWLTQNCLSLHVLEPRPQRAQIARKQQHGHSVLSRQLCTPVDAQQGVKLPAAAVILSLQLLAAAMSAMVATVSPFALQWSREYTVVVSLMSDLTITNAIACHWWCVSSQCAGKPGQCLRNKPDLLNKPYPSCLLCLCCYVLSL